MLCQLNSLHFKALVLCHFISYRFKAICALALDQLLVQASALILFQLAVLGLMCFVCLLVSSLRLFVLCQLIS